MRGIVKDIQAILILSPFTARHELRFSLDLEGLAKYGYSILAQSDCR